LEVSGYKYAHETDLKKLNITDEFDLIIVSPANHKDSLLLSHLFPKTPFVIISMAYELLQSMNRKRVDSLLDRNLSLCTGIVVDCDYLRSYLLNKGVSTSKILTTSYVWQKFTELKKRHNLGIPNIGTNRTFTDIHNNRIILDATLGLDPQTFNKLVFVGEKTNPIFDNLDKSYIDKKVDIHPYFQDFTDFYNHIDIYISASIHDGKSISILEAMNYEKIVIAPRIQCNQEYIVHGETGFLYDVNSTTSLREQIRKVLSLDADTLDKIKKQAKIQSQRHTDYDKNSKQIKSFLEVCASPLKNNGLKANPISAE